MKPYEGPIKDIETEAYVVHEPGGPFTRTKIILDEVRPDELLIQMKYTGICHSDIVMQQNQLKMCSYPAIFGHEGAGHILAIGSAVQDKSLHVGDAVLLSFSTCGKCAQCKDGTVAFCIPHPKYNLSGLRQEDQASPARLVDGTPVTSQFFGQSSFSKLSVVKERSVVKCEYPEFMELYAPMGCGYQTGAGTILNALKPAPSSSIAVFGLGSVGLSAVMAAKYLDVRQIIAVDIVDSKLELAKELGATHTVNSLKVPHKNVLTAIRSLTENNEGPNFAVDCTGVVSVIHDVIEVVASAGTAALVGIVAGGSRLYIDAIPFIMGNKKLVGIIGGASNPQVTIPELVLMHREGCFPVEKLGRLYPAEKIEEAVRDMQDGKVVKPVLQWW